MVEVTIGISLFINYILREHLGVISGGFVCPAYIAIFAHKPLKILITLAISFLTFLTIRLLRKVMFLIERRKLMLCLIIGFAYNFTLLRIVEFSFPDNTILSHELNVIGNIVTGIIAYWMDEQGPRRTLSVMWINALLTMMIVMLIFGRIFSI